MYSLLRLEAETSLRPLRAALPLSPITLPLEFLELRFLYLPTLTTIPISTPTFAFILHGHHTGHIGRPQLSWTARNRTPDPLHVHLDSLLDTHPQLRLRTTRQDDIVIETWTRAGPTILIELQPRRLRTPLLHI